MATLNKVTLIGYVGKEPDATKEDVIEWFGLREHDIDWFTIKEINEKD